MNTGVEPMDPGTAQPGEPVEPEERGKRIVLILLFGVVVVFGLVIIVSALAPDS